MLPKKKVLIIDGSAFVRQFLKEIFNQSGDLTVAAAVNDFNKACNIIKADSIDVITLDIAIPEMDSLGFLQNLMQQNPKPVVLISSLTPKNSNHVVKALSLGAIDIVAKPEIGYKEGLELLADEIVSKVRIAAKARVSTTYLSLNRDLDKRDLNQRSVETTSKIIAIGASTGGTIALNKIIQDLHPDIPGIVIIQHMPEMFTDGFAQSLDQAGPLQVKEAADGESILKGRALVVPGGKNLAIVKKGSEYIVRVSSRTHQSVYNPSIDHTLLSIADQVGPKAMGVILTGMGDDGAKGLKAMFDQGAFTMAQDEKSSVVFGMPQKAIEYGGVHRVVPLEEIAHEINRWSLSNQE